MTNTPRALDSFPCIGSYLVTNTPRRRRVFPLFPVFTRVAVVPQTRATYEGRSLGLLPRISAALANNFVNLSLGRPPAAAPSGHSIPSSV